MGLSVGGSWWGYVISSLFQEPGDRRLLKRTSNVEGAEAQARQAMRDGIRLVELAGGSRDDGTQVLGFGRDLSYEPTLRSVLAAEFGDKQPAYHGITTFVRPVLEVMVEVTAYIND